MWYVNIIESEAGWGRKVDETIEFLTKEEAIEFANDYNTRFNPPLKKDEKVPDWYMAAGRPYYKNITHAKRRKTWKVP